MGKKQITRKEFLNRTIAGFAGISLIPGNLPSGSNGFARRAIGKTGIMISPVCFGAPRTNDPALIKYAIGKGIDFIDTGRAYANGNNEKLVGKSIAGIRQNVIIQSKIRLEMNELPSKGKGRKGAGEIRTALASKFEQSLKALDTNYIDVLLVHDALDEGLLYHPETMKYFSDIKTSGLIKAHGFSTHNDHMELLERNNQERFYDTVMIPFNPHGSFVHSLTGRYSEWDQEKLITILTEASGKGIGVIAMKTCSGGKFSPSPDIEPDYKHAVAWVLSQKFISAAAIAMSSFEEVDEHSSLL